MSFYCKYLCGRQAMNEPFKDNTCDDCWEKGHNCPHIWIAQMTGEEEATEACEKCGLSRVMETYEERKIREGELEAEIRQSQEQCVECGAWPDEGHGTGCVAVE